MQHKILKQIGTGNNFFEQRLFSNWKTEKVKMHDARGRQGAGGCERQERRVGEVGGGPRSLGREGGAGSQSDEDLSGPSLFGHPILAMAAKKIRGAEAKKKSFICFFKIIYKTQWEWKFVEFRSHQHKIIRRWLYRHGGDDSGHLSFLFLFSKQSLRGIWHKLIFFPCKFY